MKTRLVLLASLAFNLGLTLILFWLKPGVPERLQRGEYLPEEPQTNSAQPFRWSQLESADYPTYIANLRAIGCPERTVREIIGADLDDLFAPRRNPLQAQLVKGDITPQKRVAVEDGLTRLCEEESAVMRALFGASQQDASATGAQSHALLRPRRTENQDTAATMPLVFQAIDTNQLSFSQDDMRVIEQVRQTFVTELGTNQDVNSPEYLHRWQKAQVQADNLLDAMLGRQALLQYQQAAEQVTATPTPSEASPPN